MLPENISVVGKVYNVVPKDIENLCGVNLRTRQIVVDTDVEEGLERVDLLEQSLHAVNEELRADLTDGQVHTLAAGIYALLVNNPALVAFLMPMPIKKRKN